MLSNAYFLAKFRFDTAENEAAKNLQNFAKFANFADPNFLNSQPSAPLDPEELRAARQTTRGGLPSSSQRAAGTSWWWRSSLPCASARNLEEFLSSPNVGDGLKTP